MKSGTTDERPTVTPRDYELAVKSILDAAADGLTAYESKHLAPIDAHDGEYIIDIVARFEALGANIVVLVECKHQGRKVERADVQVLRDKLRSSGAHKALLFSVSGFQKGAIEYAAVHGIALIQFASGITCWITRSAGPRTPPPVWANIPAFVGWWHRGGSVCLLSEDHSEYTREALGLLPQR